MSAWKSGVLSDWKIKIDETIYTVHRQLLAVGPRRSLFFQTMFTSAAFAPHHDQCTDLSDLPDLCKEVSVMEALLNWIYEGTETDLSPTNAIPVMCIADRLQITGLCSVVKEFLKKYETGKFNSQWLQDAIDCKQSALNDLLITRFATGWNSTVEFPALIALAKGKKREETTPTQTIENSKICKKRRLNEKSTPSVPVSPPPAEVDNDDNDSDDDDDDDDENDENDENDDNDDDKVESQDANEKKVQKEEKEEKDTKDITSKTRLDIPLFSFNIETICAILSHQDIRIHNEDEIFKYLEKLMASHLFRELHEITRLWQCCRFPMLSSSCLLQGFNIPSVPRHLLHAAQYIRLKHWDRVEKIPVATAEQLQTELYLTIRLPTEDTTNWQLQVKTRNCLQCQKPLVPNNEIFAPPTATHTIYHSGCEIDIWCEHSRGWYQGVVLYQINPNTVRVHYNGWGSRYDRDVPITSLHLASLNLFTERAHDGYRKGFSGPSPLTREMTNNTPPVVPAAILAPV